MRYSPTNKETSAEYSSQNVTFSLLNVYASEKKRSFVVASHVDVDRIVEKHLISVSSGS